MAHELHRQFFHFFQVLSLLRSKHQAHRIVRHLFFTRNREQNEKMLIKITLCFEAEDSFCACVVFHDPSSRVYEC